ncbi:MAG: GNAT family N-acetyltransferase [Clostridia bacterium]|nr:GNAT family N-acetyltransferase [Clostridia bacterium]
MEIVIRKIGQHDYAAVAAIWREVLDIRNATVEHVTETYEAMRHDGGYVTFVAEADGKIVGLVTAVKVLAIGHPGGYVKMNGIGVLPEYRHQGIGKALMEHVERFAVKQGAPYVGLASGINRVEAHAFYGNSGYQKTSYWFRKNLE